MRHLIVANGLTNIGMGCENAEVTPKSFLPLMLPLMSNEDFQDFVQNDDGPFQETSRESWDNSASGTFEDYVKAMGAEPDLETEIFEAKRRAVFEVLGALSMRYKQKIDKIDDKEVSYELISEMELKGCQVIDQILGMPEDKYRKDWADYCDYSRNDLERH